MLEHLQNYFIILLFTFFYFAHYCTKFYLWSILKQMFITCWSFNTCEGKCDSFGFFMLLFLFRWIIAVAAGAGSFLLVGVIVTGLIIYRYILQCIYLPGGANHPSLATCDFVKYPEELREIENILDRRSPPNLNPTMPTAQYTHHQRIPCNVANQSPYMFW